MGYVAVKGGQDAIENANKLVDYFRWRGKTTPIELDQARTQMRLAVDRAMGEGSLYAPAHAALALLQVEGDSFEAAFHLRAYRATLERRYFAEVLNTREMFVHRRISSTFREIPGGQILGPTRDFSFRLLKPTLLNATLGSIEKFIANLRDEVDPSKLHAITTYKKVIDIFLQEGWMSKQTGFDEDRRVFDVTREAIKFPVPRSGTLQMLARAETGALMCMAYSTMRGFGDSHATVGELRVGDVPVRIVDKRGRRRYAGRIKVTEAEMVGSDDRGPKSAAPKLSIGYGLCFGQNETKAICMGVVESALREPNPDNPANNQEFVLYHTEVIEAYGFTNHLKLPHYVTFQADLEGFRRVARIAEEKERDEVAAIAGAEDNDD
ncbi:carbon-phosphorus lyase complex subunit PhnI [Acidicapsa acidisoli]|uniref:carbon-phosphorus lyase complex subunit PhnI n=1 Tax=Acidicapsa acidisoli TaxID=1615681 RepID=UPI0021DF8437|nr:carbon-phosphorus lyase complex subunit PhnI [Acidicapsa acidisoli]